VRFGIASRESRKRRNRLLAGKASWTDLRNYSKFTKYGMKQDFYEKMIMYFDPKVHFADVEDARFFGKGEGMYTLNSYRNVTLFARDKKLLAFEKVYLRESPDFKKMYWFYEEIYPQIESRLEIPEVILIKGNALAIVYFDWFEDLSVPARNDIMDAYKTVSDTLDNVVVSNDANEQKVISDFTVNSFFRTKFVKARAWLTRHMGPNKSLYLKQICKNISENRSIRRGFIHGDLNTANLTIKGLIDFDYCGYHPKAYEHASFITGHLKFEELTDFYDVCSSMNINMKDHDEMLALLFFYFVFSCRKNRKASDKFLQVIWRELDGHAKKMGIYGDGDMDYV